MLGNSDPEKRIAIVSFNVRTPGGEFLHHKLVTALLNDLFGIQSRAGCSCAGPYGLQLLGIDTIRSEKYRHAVAEGFNGLKPGWCRVGFHWVMDDLEADYVINAVHLIARYGYRFAALYRFDLRTGAWTHRAAGNDLPEFSVQAALHSSQLEAVTVPDTRRRQAYNDYLAEARKLADELSETDSPAAKLPQPSLEDLRFFSLQQDALLTGAD